MTDRPVPPSRRRLRALARLALTVLLCYGGTILVLVVIENWLVFRPTKASVAWVPPKEDRYEDVWLQTEDGTRIHGWWLHEPGSGGAILFAHGNAGNLSCWATFMAALGKVLGQSVLLFDYPGYGHSGGSPSEPGCYAAGEAALAWLTQEKAIPGDRIILMGESLGGGIATDLAANHPCRALVLFKTFTSIREVAQRLYFWLPIRRLMRNEFNNLAKIRHVSSPVFLAHGTADRLVPYAHSKQLLEAAPGPKHLHTMEGKTHDDPMDAPAVQALVDFLRQHP